MMQRCQKCGNEFPTESYQGIFVTCHNCRRPDRNDHPENRHFHKAITTHLRDNWNGQNDNVEMSLDQTIDADAHLFTME